MPVIPPSIGGLRVGSLAEGTRLAVGTDKQIKPSEASGPQSGTNVFARTWDFLTRTPQEVAANKAVAHAFVDGLKDAYGPRVADLASRELKGQLQLGRPLTARRFDHIVTTSALTKQFLDAVDRRLGHQASADVEVSDRDVRRNTGNFLKASHQDPAELDDTVKRAVESAMKTLEDSRWLKANGMDVEKSLQRFTPQETRMLHEAGLSIEIGLQYKDRGVPIHPRTLVGNFRGENLVGQPKALGGSVSSVWKATYAVHEKDKSFNRAVVFKEATAGQGYGEQAARMGIDKGDPRMAVRNVATLAVDELLGFKLVPNTQFGMLDGKLGLVMDFAHGATPASTQTVPLPQTESDRLLKQLQGLAPEDFQASLASMECRLEGGKLVRSQQFGLQDLNYGDAKVQRSLVQLQLMDALTAQGDRHAGNYVVRLSEKGELVKLDAVDNDQSFGPTLLDPNELVNRAPDDKGARAGGHRFGNPVFHGVMLPPVVDRDMKAAIDRISPDDLRKSLGGLLTEKEILATIVRLDAIKLHLSKLEAQGNIIEPAQWGSQRVTQLLADPKTSYVGRDAQYMRELTPITYGAAQS